MGAMQYLLRGRHLAMPLLLLATACVRPATDSRASGSWTYEVEAPAEGSRVVGVEVTFDNARTDRLIIARESTPFMRDVQVKTGSGYRSVEHRGSGWYEPTCVRHCTIRYKIDLGEVAQACGDEVDCARRVG